MLILSRRKGESIIIDGNIEVKVVELSDGRVRLGIEAPKTIEIVRKEIYKKTEEENKEALKTRIKIEDLKDLF